MRQVIIQTDFGTGSVSVSAMHGVCAVVHPDLRVDDGNNAVKQFDVLSASDSLMYLLPYWPQGSVFVSVVDPGVGTSRRSCVALLKNGQYVVTPDNGTLTYIKERIGIEAVREIDESVNRMPGSEDVHIFHGRDVYAYCAARLAAGIIDFEGVGPEYPVDEVVEVPYLKPGKEGGAVFGMINEADPYYGLIDTNIPFGWLSESGMVYGDTVTVTVENNGEKVLELPLKLEKTFGCVPVGDPLIFSSEMRTVMMAINQGNAAETYGIGDGTSWKFTVRKGQ